MSQSPSQFVPGFSAEHLAQLACPACRGGLQFAPNGILCQECGRIYPLSEGIPVLIAERALPPNPLA